MAVHIEPMSHPSAASSASLPATLLRRLFLLVLIMVEAAIGLAYLARALHEHLPAWAVVALSDSLTGLVAGLAARWMLRRQSGSLRLAAALAVLVGGMLFQGWLTGWQVGLGPLEFGRSRPDWIGLGQFSLGMGITLLPLYAWQRPALKVEVAAAPPLPVRRPARVRGRAQGRAAGPMVRRSGRARTGSVARSAARSKMSPLTPTPLVVAERAVKPKRRRGYRRKPRLQFISEEEHRCPYCLDLVSENDPRGSVECKVCHTLHHADCWAITGSCQVPHYNV